MPDDVHAQRSSNPRLLSALTCHFASFFADSICGSLPLVGDMQEAGFDLQISGYGKSSVYHGNNEYCSLNDM